MAVVDTFEFKQWMANFPSQYHPTVEFLVGELHYLDESTFRSDLTGQILHDFDRGLIIPPALVIPIRTGPEMGLPRSELAVIFENVFPAHKLMVPDTGSEALCANIIRNLEKAHGAALGTIAIPQTLDDLRRRKIRSIILVGDYAGSGSQATEAAKIWTRNRSIRSWRSYHLVTINVVLHSASIAAKKALSLESSIDRLSLVSIVSDFDNAEWTAEQRKDVEDFCKRFARRPGRDSLGWKGSAGLFVMQHRAPNNLPAVLVQTKGPSLRRDGWYPLLPNGLVPGNIADALRVQNQWKREPSLDRKPSHDRVLDPHLSAVLDALRKGAQTPERISALADISLANSIRVLAELAASGYVDARGYLTDEGRRLLASDVRPIDRYRLSGSDEPYYPQVLRGVGDI